MARKEKWKYDINEYQSESLVRLVNRGEFRDTKMYLFDKMIIGMINSLSGGDIANFLLLVSMFARSLLGGTKDEKAIENLKELIKDVDTLIEEYVKNDMSIRKNIKKLMGIYGRVIEYANEQYNYLFKRRIDVAEGELDEET